MHHSAEKTDEESYQDPDGYIILNTLTAGLTSPKRDKAMDERAPLLNSVIKGDKKD